MTAEKYSMQDPRNQTEQDRAYLEGLEAYFSRSLGSSVDKLRNFAKFIPRQSLSLFLAKHEMFQKLVHVHGHIIECGVFLGGGLICAFRAPTCCHYARHWPLAQAGALTSAPPFNACSGACRERIV
jgi:hypothetical protein